MPDLTIETGWVCRTLLAWAGTDRGHVVRWGPTPAGPAQYEYDCDCKGFHWRHDCRHVRRAETDRAFHCRWEQHHEGGEPAGDRCPRCGGALTAERYAV